MMARLLWAQVEDRALKGEPSLTDSKLGLIRPVPE